jgi:hypothetical protein
MRGMIAVSGTPPMRPRQTAASTASMPNARSRRRGQVPQPPCGAPQAQELTPAPRTAAPSNAPLRATHDTMQRNSPRLAGSGPPAVTSRIYTSLTDVTSRPSRRGTTTRLTCPRLGAPILAIHGIGVAMSRHFWLVHSLLLLGALAAREATAQINPPFLEYAAKFALWAGSSRGWRYGRGRGRVRNVDQHS